MPRDYILFRWRQEMGVSYAEMLRTPFEIIIRDMEYIRMTNAATEHAQKVASQ